MLPHYGKPPLNEVVFTLRVRSPGFRIGHVGLFWSKVRDTFPQVASQPPIGSADGQVPVEEPTGLPWIRTWLISKDETRLLQVQQDRFIFNWRQRGEHEYPRFESLRLEAFRWFEAYEQFHIDAGLGALSLVGTELSYINHIKQGVEVSALDEIASVLPFLNAPAAGALGRPRVLGWSGQFELPGGAGLLRAQVGLAVQRQSKAQLYQFELMAQSRQGVVGSLAAANPWFDGARKAIVLTFADLTDMRVQRDIWERRDA
ncbi:MAG: TIGR04255 family protein [Rubrivivax sp.]|nr:TIGR04255 family protein [Rubrivivax sp.]